MLRGKRESKVIEKMKNEKNKKTVKVKKFKRQT